MRNAIIFDLDRTLWDAAERATGVWNRVLLEHGVSDLKVDQKTISAVMGKQLQEIVKLLLPTLPEEKQQKILEDYEIAEVAYLRENGAPLYAGVRETLAALSRSYDLYIVSNYQDGYVPAFLHAHKLAPYFQDFAMSGKTGLSKGENIKNLMKKHAIQKTVYVGDTEGDEQASREAGIPFIWARYGFGTAQTPDAVITEISELSACAARFFPPA